MCKIILTTFLLLAIPTLILADDIIYDSPYGGKKVGRIEESGRLYNQPYGGKAVGKYKDGKVYDTPYGGKAIGRTENNEGAGYWLLKEKEDTTGDKDK